MQKLNYIPVLLFALTACQEEEIVPDNLSGKGTLNLTLETSHNPFVTRAVAEGLALTILDGEGMVCQEYAAGSVPSSISLTPGDYTLRVFSENQSTWALANDNLGEACYWGETTVSIVKGKTTECTYSVPATNYAVTLTLPSFFSSLFTTYTFQVVSGSRSVSIHEGQRAYFSADNGFSYILEATNTEGISHQHPSYAVSQVTAGKLYNVTYAFGSGDGNDVKVDVK